MSSAELFGRLSDFAARGLNFLAEPKGRRSYRELISAIESMCGWFDRATLRAGDRFAIASAEPFATAVCTFACLMEGITVVVVPAGESGGSIQQQLARIGCKAALFDGAKSTVLLAPDPSALSRLFGKIKFQPFVDALQPSQARLPKSGAVTTAGAVVIFSSGSTGTPKGVRWSCSALFAHLETFRKTLRYEPAMTLVNGLPLEHTDGFFHGPLICGWAGMTWVRPPRFSFNELDVWSELMTRDEPTVLVSVPTMLDMMLRLSPSPLDRQLAQLKVIVSSAERLKPPLWQPLEAQYAPVVNIYGMSETVNGSLFALPWNRIDYDSVGKPIDIQAAVRDDTGRDVEAGRAGILHLKGDSIFDGYETGTDFEPAPLEDGWFKTGDMALHRRDGLYEIIGRADEARNIGGVLVHPKEIDDALSRLSYVKASKTILIRVTGAINEFAPISFVETSEAEAATRIRHDLEQSLASVRQPRDILTVDSLPVTGVGKIDQTALLKLYKTHQASEASELHGGTTETQIKLLAARVLNAPIETLSMASRHGSTIGWDSFGHINLALAIERHFGIRLSYADVTSATSLADFAAIAAAKTSSIKPSHDDQN